MIAPDLRLLLPAATCWFALLAAALLSARLDLLLAAAGVAGALWLLRGSDNRLWAAAGIAVAAASFGVAGIRAAARSDGPLPALVRAHRVAELTVVLSADPVRRDGISATTRRPYHLVIVPAQVVVLDSGGRRWTLRQPVLLLAQGDAWARLLPSQRVRTAGQLSAPRAPDTVAAVVDVRGTPRLLGRPSAVQRIAGSLRARLRGAVSGLPAGPRALLPGLVDGDTSALPDSVTTEFRRTGLTHLVAVSGTNVAIVSGVVLAMARRLRAGPRLSGAVAAMSVLAFVVIARPSGSVLRAAVMGVCGLVGVAASRPRPALTGLGGAVLLLLLVEPGLARQPGFALSVLATLGLLVLAPGWTRVLARRLPEPIAAAVAVPAAAQLACAPVIAMIGGGTSLVAIPANLLAAPAVAPATILGVVTVALAPVAPPAATGTAWLAQFPCRWLLAVARGGSALPYASIPWPGGAGGAVLLALVSVLVAAAIRTAIGRAGARGSGPLRGLPGLPGRATERGIVQRDRRADAARGDVRGRQRGVPGRRGDRSRAGRGPPP